MLWQTIYHWHPCCPNQSWLNKCTYNSVDVEKLISTSRANVFQRHEKKICSNITRNLSQHGKKNITGLRELVCSFKIKDYKIN